jgi:hypothetical protein
MIVYFPPQSSPPPTRPQSRFPLLCNFQHNTSDVGRDGVGYMEFRDLIKLKKTDYAMP